MPKIRKELLDELLANYENPEDLIGPDGLLKQLTGALVERALEAEMTSHLGYEKDDPAGRGTGNSRNGKGSKTLKTRRGKVEVDVPRDRKGSFEPQLVRKRQTRFDGFDEKIISMYARGMPTREIQGHLEDLYGIEVSPDLISKVTAEVLDEVAEWQSRTLDPVWPIVYLDALVVKIREEGSVRNKSVYVALGIRMDGNKEVLGLWIEATEGARFWLNVITELKNRGVEDILIACCDGLKGFPDAIESVFPGTVVQTCIVHMIRNSLHFVSWSERKKVAAALKPIYTAQNRKAAEAALESFDAEWGQKYPSIPKSWRNNWERVVPFLDFPLEIRKAVYTTNAIESLHSTLRKAVKIRGHFPSDDAALKLIYLNLRNLQKKWTMPIRSWRQALQQLAIHFEGRIEL
jgi:putative transposase